MKIFINPGHDFLGINDPGAVNPKTGDRECDFVSEFAIYLEEELHALGHETVRMQSDDLVKVCQWANIWEADVFISLHCNACESHQGRGIETYYWSERGEHIAAVVQNNLYIAAGLQIPNRGIKKGRCYVLTHTKAPAILVELGFIDNCEELSLMRRYMGYMASGLAHAFKSEDSFWPKN